MDKRYTLHFKMLAARLFVDKTDVVAFAALHEGHVVFTLIPMLTTALRDHALFMGRSLQDEVVYLNRRLQSIARRDHPKELATALQSPFMTIETWAELVAHYPHLDTNGDAQQGTIARSDTFYVTTTQNL